MSSIAAWQTNTDTIQPEYYFNRIHERRTCYHLKTLKIAREQNKIEKISFSDSEYEDFIASLLSDL